MGIRTKSVTVTKDITYVHCDVCDASMGQGGKKCCGCGKDICEDCRIVWFRDPFWLDDNGDYPPYSCESCHNAVQPYSEAAERASAEYEQVVDKLYNEWKAKVKR